MITELVLAGITQQLDSNAFSDQKVDKSFWARPIYCSAIKPDEQINGTKTTFILDTSLINTLGKNYFRLKDFQSLKKGWDGYGAPPISKTAIKKTESILLELHYKPQIFPTGRGSIQVEYHLDINNSYELEVFPSHYTILIIHDGEETERIIRKKDAIKIMNDFVYGG